MARVLFTLQLTAFAVICWAQPLETHSASTGFSIYVFGESISGFPLGYANGERICNRPSYAPNSTSDIFDSYRHSQAR